MSTDDEPQDLKLVSRVFISQEGKMAFEFASKDLSLFSKLYPHEECYHFFEQILYSDVNWQVMNVSYRGVYIIRRWT